jgi:FAD/FMN-containing dehydrogenase
VLGFDRQRGRVTCESGVLLADLLPMLMRHGWFPPVTPGTKQVTVGGMVAADVHGKNHHVAGTFSRYVESLKLMVADGRVLNCTPTENADVFAATCGGMGLTGVILSATFRLQRIESAWVTQETLRCANLAAVMEAFEASRTWTYSVAWIDCLAGGAATGRSLFYRGEHARLDDLPPPLRQAPLQEPLEGRRTLPFSFPGMLLNGYTVRAFNTLFYGRARLGNGLVGINPFFYPLDALQEWNRIYGRKGFVQYQCVLPREASVQGLQAILSSTARAGMGSFLAVLKLFGDAGPGWLSFPREGYSLALDFPVRSGLMRLLTELDAIVAMHGGRLYLAKDAVMKPALLRRSYPQLDRFLALRQTTGADKRFTSLLAKRLEI